MSDSRGRQVTPRARVPQDLAGMTPDSARAIMKSAAKKSNKKAEEEAAARRELIRTRRRAEEDAMDMD
jgi:hypothetical protein